MICPKCSKEISDSSIYCPDCGHKISGEDSHKSVVKEKKAVNIKLILGIICVIVILVGASVGLYINSTPEVRYNKAEKAFENGNYEKAIRYYTAVGNYKDAESRLEEANAANCYVSALGLMDQGNYEEAKSELELADGYKDSAQLIKQCDYSMAEGFVKTGDYLAAAESFKAAGNYEDANDRIIALGQELVLDSNFDDAVKVFGYSKNPLSDSYAQYANGVLNLRNESYLDAASNFNKAGDLLDAKEQYKVAQYAYASKQLKAKKYSDAKKAFNKILDYNDSSNLVNACDLMLAEEEMKKGNLNTAKEMLEKMPENYTYDNSSVSALLTKLNSNSQWLAVCGIWTSTSGQMRTTQSGSYGYSNWWYYDFQRGDKDIEIRCKLNDDGSATIVTNGTIPIYINYSPIQIGIKQGTQSVNINEKVSDMGTVKINDLTAITFSPSKISVAYKKVDNSQDVYFTYTYKTDITYGERTVIY